MFEPIGRFQWLGNQFNELVDRLDKSPSLDDRKKLLKRMKVLIDEIDELILNTLKRAKQDTASSPTHDQPAAKS